MHAGLLMFPFHQKRSSYDTKVEGAVQICVYFEV